MLEARLTKFKEELTLQLTLRPHAAIRRPSVQRKDNTISTHTWTPEATSNHQQERLVEEYTSMPEQSGSVPLQKNDPRKAKKERKLKGSKENAAPSLTQASNRKKPRPPRPPKRAATPYHGPKQ